MASSLIRSPLGAEDHSVLLTVLVAIIVAIAIVRFNLFNTDRVVSAAAGYALLLLVLSAASINAVPYLARALSGVLGLDVPAIQFALALGLAAIALPVHRRVHTPQPQAPRAGSRSIGLPGLDTGDGALVAERNVFRNEGEYWTVIFDGKLVRLRNTKGLNYIAHLLRHPGQEFHVCDLLAVVGEMRPCGVPGQSDLHVSDLSDAGPLLDAKAKAAYKSRLDTLRDELEETERLNDPGRGACVRDEIEAVTNQLSAAIGLGGRDRHAASNAERARLGVTKRIKAAVEKMQQVNPTLARHLGAAITTGYFCVYAPLATDTNPWFLG